MEEADNLCNRVGIIDYGKIQTIAKPSALKSALGNEVVTFSIGDDQDESLISKLNSNDLVKEIKKENEKIIVFTTRGSELIPQLFQITTELGIKINSISLTEPTLDDVFLSYTGHGLRDEGISSPTVGSSKKSTFGICKRPPAISSLFRIPPE